MARARIDSFIRTAAKSLKLREETVQSATGGLLDFLRSQVDAGDFEKLLVEVPGAEALVTQADESADGMATAASGATLQAPVGLVSSLTASGLEFRKVADFAGEFLAFARKHVEEEVLSRVLDAAPDLVGAAG